MICIYYKLYLYISIYYIFPNAKRGFSTFLEGSRCCALQWCSGRFSALSKTDPECLEFVECLECLECLADAGTPSWLFWQSGQAGSIAP